VISPDVAAVSAAFQKMVKTGEVIPAEEILMIRESR
jgi:hypothetical protein